MNCSNSTSWMRIAFSLVFMLALAMSTYAQKKVAYVYKTLATPDATAAPQDNDAVIKMLSADEEFALTPIASDGATAIDLAGYDLVIVTESFGSGDAILKRTGSLGLKNIAVPFIYNKTYALRGGKAIDQTTQTAAVVESTDLSITVAASNQSNSLFSGLTFTNDQIPIYKETGSDLGGVGTKSLNPLTLLKLTNGGNPLTGHLLATAGAVTATDNESILLNDIPAGTQFGENAEDVTQARMLAFAFNYGASLKDGGANITDEALTIWRNAVYVLSGLTPPSTPVDTNPVVAPTKEGVITYDFRDGSIVSNHQSADGKLTLSGNYSQHGGTYGMNMKADATISIAVDGSCTVRFLGSQYSSLSMEGTAVEAGDLGTHPTKVAADLVDVYDFTYSGTAATLTFKATGAGSDVYLPSIEIIPVQKGIDFTEPEMGVSYFFDFRDQSIVASSDPGNVAIEKGLIKIESGPSNAYAFHGTQHGIYYKPGNFITLKVAGNSKIRLGGDQFGGGTITATSEAGEFKTSSQTNKTASTYADNARVFVDFIYVGGPGTVILTNSGTTSYLPVIELSPIPFEVNLKPWAQKTGTITLNGVEIGFTSGADASSNATVTVSEGTVNSATKDEANILINLGGNALSTFTPTVSGDISSVSIEGSSLLISLADSENSDPVAYKINVMDNSATVVAEPGITYNYNFADGSEVPQTGYQSLRYSSYLSKNGILTINSNTETTSGQFGFHDTAHGMVMFSGNSMDMLVAGDATVTYVVCTFGDATDAIWEFTDAQANVLGTSAAQNIKLGDAFAVSFTYKGPAGKITATLKSVDFPTAEVYIHGMSIANAAKIEVSNGKTDVWDFGAEQLDAEMYNNKLDVETINSWYPATATPGAAGYVFPSFNAGVLGWVGGSNDRLRTSNTALTRYDENLSGVTGYTGRIYVNASAATGRYFSLDLSEDDEVTVMMLTQSGGGKINFQYTENPEAQTDVVQVGLTLTEVKFVAKSAGNYHIFDTQDKPSYYRIYRKDAQYITVAGTVDVSAAANIPNTYMVVFTNAAGKSWMVAPNANAYSVDLPAGYSYELSLADANGFIISAGATVEVTPSTSTHNIAVSKVELFTVSGNIIGLGDKISNLELKYTPDPAANKIFVPEPQIDANAGTYTVSLEPNVQYTISAEGVNDFEIPANTLTIGNADQSADITFAAKATQDVSITAEGISAEALAKLALTFTNLNESGYVYSFSSVDGIKLRDGVYSVSYAGLDEYPVELTLTSNLKVAGAATTKNLKFKGVTNWPFNDKVITAATPAYKGLLFTGAISNEIAKGHLVTKADATIKIPVKVGDKVRVTYYYSADFSIEGTQYTTASNSTSQLEYAEYAYAGTEDGFVTITIGSGAATTYLTNIEVGAVMAYSEMITVGVDKDYQSINDALNAIGKMVRANDERVVVMIDPGNYEEMLVVTQKNVTLKNAAAMPTIGLTNKGVDITEGAVRITSYYGHGYNYYSQGTDQKWHGDILQVNKENGYLSAENKGAGTTNGSYWNATVVISASGFEAEDIIFENSFNQYISKKESEDVVVMWSAGSKGERPTDIGNVNVQKRSFVERAAALSITSGGDKTVLKNCRVVGRQDSFYGAQDARFVAYRGAYMGAVDYIFGGMIGVFYKSELVMNVSDDASDAAYLTAAQQSKGRGYLMYETTVTSAEPGVETASTMRAKPGFFGRPWQATTSEVVFYKTKIETSNYTGSEGKSLISPAGWNNSLGGESNMMYEFASVELSGEDNSASRASWATKLTEPILKDGAEITTFNFTKGTDNWDPIPALLDANNMLASLEIAEGTLSPAFDPAVTEYTIEVPNGTSSITVSATTASPAASLSVETFATLPGSDKVIVTAENGEVKEYTITVSVAKKDQTITFESISNKVIGDVVSLSATATSGLAVSFTLVSGPATLSGSELTLTGAGDVVIAANQSGNEEYYAANEVTATISVSKKSQTITLDAVSGKVYGDVVTLSASATSSFEIALSLVSGSATLTGTELTLTGAGDVVVAANQAGNDEFNAAEEVKITISVGKATITATAGKATITEGDALPSFEISYSGFKFTDGSIDLDQLPTASTSATSASPAGSYDIVVSGGSDVNYDFAYVKGVLTVEAAPVLGADLKAVSVYPNPVSNILNINLAHDHLSVIDINGRELIKAQASSQIDLSQLRSGVLFVRLFDVSGKMILQERIIKK